MQIIEDITYNIDDIISQIQETYGFMYTRIDDYSGYIILDNKITLNIEFNESERKLDSAVIELPDDVIDITDSTVVADIYQSSIESSSQVVSLIKRMLGGSSDD